MTWRLGNFQDRVAAHWTIPPIKVAAVALANKIARMAWAHSRVA
jgi:hypothetical protein